jgi:hypothetical protein
MLYVICLYLQARRQKLNSTTPRHLQIGQEPISHGPSNTPVKFGSGEALVQILARMEAFPSKY